jgi:hypothetical protein
LAATLSAEDEADLRRAAALLEGNNLVVRLSATVGRAIEGAAGPGLRILPAAARDSVRGALELAIGRVFDVAARSVAARSGSPVLDRALRSRWINMAAAVASGAGGGLGGLPGVIAELPVTTTLLMRAIAQAAAEEGQDLAEEAAKIECLEVFALGGSVSGAEDEAELGYYAMRLGFARALGGIGGRALNQVLPGAVTVAATRFGVPLAYKIAAEAVPVIGAATGALVNGLFVDHFQSKSRGHFTIRRLERRYGEAAIREAYHRVA